MRQAYHKAKLEYDIPYPNMAYKRLLMPHFSLNGHNSLEQRIILPSRAEAVASGWDAGIYPEEYVSFWLNDRSVENFFYDSIGEGDNLSFGNAHYISVIDSSETELSTHSASLCPRFDKEELQVIYFALGSARHTERVDIANRVECRVFRAVTLDGEFLTEEEHIRFVAGELTSSDGIGFVRVSRPTLAISDLSVFEGYPIDVSHQLCSDGALLSLLTGLRASPDLISASDVSCLLDSRCNEVTTVDEYVGAAVRMAATIESPSALHRIFEWLRGNGVELSSEIHTLHEVGQRSYCEYFAGGISRPECILSAYRSGLTVDFLQASQH